MEHNLCNGQNYPTMQCTMKLAELFTQIIIQRDRTKKKNDMEVGAVESWKIKQNKTQR